MFSNHLPRDLGSETIGRCHPGLCHQSPHSIPLSGLHPLPDPVFLFHHPAIPEHHINSAQHRAVAACRQEVLCPPVPSSLLGPCCALGVGSGEAMTHACGRVALGLAKLISGWASVSSPWPREVFGHRFSYKV